jgi:chaperonin GroES
MPHDPTTYDPYKIRPLGSRVIVKFDPQQQYLGDESLDVLIPEKYRRCPLRGEVIAVGPGRLMETGRRDHMGMRPGDFVRFGPYNGLVIEQDFDPDHEYRVMEQWKEAFGMDAPDVYLMEVE